jgi:invasion protein IalB
MPSHDIPSLPRRSGRDLASASARLSFAVAIAATMGGLAQVYAETSPSPTPAPIETEPQSTTATYGDWVLRCQRSDNGGQTQRICEVAQTLESKGQGVIAQIAIGRLSPKEPLKLTIVLPTNIALPGSVNVLVTEKDETPAALAWKRCLPGGCVADVEVREETLKRWRAQTGRGQINYTVASGQNLSIPFSFRGLAVALDSLAKTLPSQ